MRTLSHTSAGPARLGARALAVAGSLMATLALPVVAAAQSKPVVAILSFDNNSVGSNRADFDGLGKGVQDLLISDMANNANIRLVDRERIQKVLDEQNLVKSGAIDAQTAVRVGKLLGAQYMIWGGFMNVGGQMVLTAHSTDVETSQIQNPVKVQKRGDDVLGLIADMSTKLNSEIKFAPKAAAPRGRGDDQGASQSGAQKQSSNVQTKQAGAEMSKPAEKVEHYDQVVALSAKTKSVKLPMASARVYADALQAIDDKNPQKAATLLNQLVQKFPDFEPAKQHLDKLQQKSGD